MFACTSSLLRFGLCTLAVWLGMAQPSAAQQNMQQPEFQTPAPQSGKMERKVTRWFRSPREKDPEAQWLHAQTLHQENLLSQASTAYDRLVRAWPDSPRAAAAQLQHARLLEETGQYDEAFEAYQYLIEFYAGAFDHQEVLSAQFRIAQHLMTTPRGKFLFFPGFMAPERALPLFEKIIASGPAASHAAEAQFNIARIHEELKALEDAIMAYETVHKRYPASPLAGDAAFHKAACLTRIARKSPRDLLSNERALSALAAFLAAYRNHPGTEEAIILRDRLNEQRAALHFQQAEFYDKIARNNQAALLAYSNYIRQFPLTPQAAQAQNRIQAIQAAQAAARHVQSGKTTSPE